MDAKAIIIMGSERDLELCRDVAKYLKQLGVDYIFRVASAHKTPEKVLAILKEFEKTPAVYVAVAGRSNALSSFIDANTSKPVIACPPYSDKFGGVDVFSSIRVPSGIGSVLTIEPEGAAIAVAKILALSSKELEKSLKDYQAGKKREIEKADETLRKLK